MYSKIGLHTDTNSSNLQIQNDVVRRVAWRVDGGQSGAVDFKGLAVDDGGEFVGLDDIVPRKLEHLATFLQIRAGS